MEVRVLSSALFASAICLGSRSTGPEIADRVFFALLGEPACAEQFLGFLPMLQGPAFRATVFLPNGVGQRLDVRLLPGFHNP
jgi:hypothetical protein